MKKFLVMALVCLGIFSANFSVNAAEKIDSGLNFQQLESAFGYEGWATVVNCNEWISLREGPSTSLRRLEKIPLGATVKIFKFDGMEGANPSPYNGFIRVYYNGIWGWCLQQYIRIDSIKAIEE